MLNHKYLLEKNDVDTARNGPRKVREKGTSAVVGLDPHLDRLPQNLRGQYEGRTGQDFREAAADAVVTFNRLIIDEHQ